MGADGEERDDGRWQYRDGDRVDRRVEQHLAVDEGAVAAAVRRPPAERFGVGCIRGSRPPDGVVLGAVRRVRSPLMERDSVEKLHKADDHVGIASAGHVAGGRSR